MFNARVAALDREKLYHHHSQFPSLVHALVQIVGTFTFVFYGREGYDDVLADGASPTVVFDERTFVPYGLTGLGPAVFMGIFVGYLVSDVAAAPSLKEMGYEYVMHHFAAALCWTFCAGNRIAQDWATLLQFNELSTPFLNVRQYLFTAGYKSSDKPLVVSSLVFFVAFSLVRVAPLPFVLRNWIARDLGAVRTEAGIGSAILLSMFLAIHVSLQCGWFIMMIKMVAKAFRKPAKQKKQ